jgi:CRP-like cAMP-binding protein
MQQVIDMISIMSDWHQIFTNAPLRTIAQGKALFRREDAVQSMFLVRSGSIALERPMADGTALTLHVATTGTALAEASLFAETYHCDAVARTDTQVACVSRMAFLAALQRMPNTALSLMETHAKEVQILRARIEILRLRRVSEKLDAWLDLYGEPPKGEWVRVADEIGVSQPALYRELAKRKTNSTP